MAMTMSSPASWPSCPPRWAIGVWRPGIRGCWCAVRELDAAAAFADERIDLAVLDVTPDGLRLVELAPGVELDALRAQTGVPVAS